MDTRTRASLAPREREELLAHLRRHRAQGVALLDDDAFERGEAIEISAEEYVSQAERRGYARGLLGFYRRPLKTLRRFGNPCRLPAELRSRPGHVPITRTRARERRARGGARTARSHGDPDPEPEPPPLDRRRREVAA